MAPEVVGVPRGERPLDGGDGVLLRFARDLRLLREKAGQPTYRALGARAHYSAATLSEAAGGRKLPELPGDAGGIRTLDFSADGAHLAGGAIDGAVRIWNIADPARLTGPAELRGRHEGAVRDMTFSPDSAPPLRVSLPSLTADTSLPTTTVCSGSGDAPRVAPSRNSSLRQTATSPGN